MTDKHSVELPLTDFVIRVARETGRTIIDEHVKSCPVSEILKKLDGRVNQLEDEFTAFDKRFHLVLGAIIGSGALGGSVGALIMRVFG